MSAQVDNHPQVVVAVLSIKQAAAPNLRPT